MKIRIEFDTDNAAFEDNGRDEEVAAVLDRARRKIDRLEPGERAMLRDSNGNTIGHVEVLP